MTQNQSASNAHDGLYLDLPSLDCISVDTSTGVGHFKLPLAWLGDAQQGSAFELALTSTCSSPSLNLLPTGAWTQSFKMFGEWDGRQADWDYTLNFKGLPHVDGRSINATMNNHGRDEGPGFVLDAAAFAKARLAFVNTQEAGDRSLSEGQLEALTDAQLQAHQEKYSHFKEIDDRHISLIAKNGTAQIFECAGTGKFGSIANVLLTHFISPTGRVLTFTWDNRLTPHPRLTAIDDEVGRLVTVAWTSDQQFVVTVYPGSTEQVKYDCSVEANAWVLEVTGADAVAQKQVYRIDTRNSRINGIELKTHYKTDEGQESLRVDSETVTYKDDKVVSHGMMLAGGLERVSCEYAYQTDKTTQVFKRGTQEVATHVQEFKGGQPVAETVTANGVTTVSRQALVLDEGRGLATLTATRQAGDQPAQQSTATFDVLGNLVKLEEAGQVTEWSYFNNYKHYEVEEWRVVKGESGFAAWMYRAMFNMLGDLVPHQLGSDRGVTTSVWTLSSVRASSSSCDYARKTFNLPLDVKYPGDFDGFTTHVESQKVSRIVNGKAQVEQVTYFGYGSLTCVPLKGLSRTHVVVPTVKLTVLDPDLENVDLSDIQHDLATAAADQWLKSLSKQIEKARSEDEKKVYRAQQTNLKESLKAQSKLNATGFKLKSLAASRIQVEVLEYHTDAAKPGFGQVKSQTVYQLDKDGKEVVGSRTVTSLQHSVDAKDPRKASIGTTVKTQDLEFTSSQTRAGFAGRVLETLDSQGIKNSWSFARNGLVKDEQASRDKNTSNKVVYSTALLEGGLIRYQAVDGSSGAGRRVVVDGLGREQKVEVSWDGTNWLLWSQFSRDDQGRQSSVIEYDYDAAGKRLFTHATTWTYDDARKSSTVTQVLKGAEDKELDRKTQVVTAIGQGATLTHGTFRQHRHFDPNTRSLTVTQGSADGKGPQLKQQTFFTEQGQPQSFTAWSVVGNKESKLHGVTYGVDSAGLLSNLTLDSGQTSSYEYDRFGRLTKQDNNGIVIRNQYPANSLTEVATTASIEGGDDRVAAISLGSQTIDGLGRVKTRTVNDVASTYSYQGAAHWGKTSEVAGPAVMAGYTSGWDADTLAYTETCPVRDTLAGDASERATTVTHFSRRGRALSVTDVLGYITAYSYDVYGRVSKLSNAGCETSFTYGDNGLLLKEVVDEPASDYCVTVTYAYDVMGNELSRTFECPGMATHTLSRTLLADGRLSKSVLTVGSAEHSSDEYSYDAQGRLIAWSASNKHYEYATSPVNRQTFSYDVLGNVVTTQPKAGPDGAGYAWGYLMTREYSADKPGLLIKHDSQAVASDGQGRWTKTVHSISYHPNGQLNRSYRSAQYTGDRYHDYAYDDVGRLRGVFEAGGNQSPLGYQFHYRGGKIYARTQRTANPHQWKSVTRRDLVLLNDSPSCLLQEVRDNGKRVTSSFVLRDAAGTVFATIRSKGNIEYHGYSPYGYRRFDENASHWLGFKGEAVLPNGTYYLGSRRVYDPFYMSFQSPDSWSPFGAGGPAAYAYCAGDPVNYHDPSGHQMVAQYQRQEAIAAMYTKEFRIGMAVAGVVMAPFTGGASLQTTLAVTGLTMVAAGFDIASIVLEDSDPELARVFGYVAFGTGFASMGVGVRGALRTSGRLPGSSLRQAMRSPVTKEVSRMHPTVTASHTVFGKSMNSPYSLWSSGQNSKRLVINAHGTPVKGYSDAVTGQPVPGYFKTNVAKKIGFYADEGFKVSMKGHNYAELIGGGYIPSNYYEPGQVPNYFLTHFSTADTIKEVSGFASIPGFDVSRSFGQVAMQAGVDYVVIEPGSVITLEQLLNNLASNGFTYEVVDGLFCRGTLDATMNSFMKSGMHNFFKGWEWWVGARRFT
ncbi:RHS repeat domain-containing protein [Pseudomonas sp. GZD-222]|uniref:RHS repeat domain-containing protein n=1 Tax=Pseudomonas sp. GZD-222 TaxID=3404805 RepID=UPI003BB683FA